MKDKPLVVSLSASNMFDTCEMAYWQRYILGLERRDKTVPLSRGIVLHNYFESYYNGLKNGISAYDSHTNALYAMDVVAQTEVAKYEMLADIIDDPDQYNDFINMPEACQRIAVRYFEARGRDDAAKYEILFVEERALVTLAPGIQSVGVIDLVTRHRDSGLVKIWEHKTTANIPPTEIRLRDLQTLLYSAKLEALHGLVPQGITWNYVRTKEPTVPKILKKGDISVAKDIDSTWGVYSAAVVDSGGDPDDVRYATLRARLQPRELEVFFPRIEHVTIMNVDYVLDNYIATARQIKRKINMWERKIELPRMHLSRDCRWCQFSQLCMVRLTDGDIDDIIKLRYRRRGETNAEQMMTDQLAERRAEPV